MSASHAGDDKRAPSRKDTEGCPGCLERPTACRSAPSRFTPTPPHPASTEHHSSARACFKDAYTSGSRGTVLLAIVVDGFGRLADAEDQPRHQSYECGSVTSSPAGDVSVRTDCKGAVSTGSFNDKCWPTAVWPLCIASRFSPCARGPFAHPGASWFPLAGAGGGLSRTSAAAAAARGVAGAFDVDGRTAAADFAVGVFRAAFAAGAPTAGLSCSRFFFPDRCFPAPAAPVLLSPAPPAIALVLAPAPVPAPAPAPALDLQMVRSFPALPAFPASAAAAAVCFVGGGRQNSETGHCLPAFTEAVTQCGCTSTHVFSSAARTALTLASASPPLPTSAAGGTSRCVHRGVSFRETSPPLETIIAQSFCLLKEEKGKEGEKAGKRKQ